jgi:hypothetical protein
MRKPHSLSEVLEVLERLRRGGLMGRAVITW